MTQNQQNLSNKDAYIRFLMGSIMTAYGTIQLIRDPKSTKGQLSILLGAMKAAEGVTKYCPRKAITSSIMDGSFKQSMMNNSVTQSLFGGADGSNQSGQNTSSSTQNSSNIMQTVGNIAKSMTDGNSTQKNGSQSSGKQGNQNANGQNAQNSNSGEEIIQAVGTIAKTISPQAGTIIDSVAKMAETQTAGNQTASSNEQGNNAGNSNGQKNSTSSSNGQKNASSRSNANNTNKQVSSKKQNSGEHTDNAKSAMSTDSQNQDSTSKYLH